MSLELLEEAPLFEPIRTMVDERRANRKAIARHMRKGKCAKHAYSRKQALTQATTLMKRGVPFLRIYKCRYGFFHLTHKKDRFAKV